MGITFTSGDLFASNLGAIGHGCNSRGVMGAGIAVEFKRRFPDMYHEYSLLCSKRRLQPGDIFVWNDDKVTVFNLITQMGFGDATIFAVESSVRKMVRAAEARGIQMIGLPRIAAGLGGLTWEPVKEALSQVGKESKVHLVVFEEFVQNRVFFGPAPQIPAASQPVPESPT